VPLEQEIQTGVAQNILKARQARKYCSSSSSSNSSSSPVITRIYILFFSNPVY